MTPIPWLAFGSLIESSEMSAVTSKSWNPFIVSAVAEKLAAYKTASYFADRRAQGDLNAALAWLSRDGEKVPVQDDVSP